MLFHEFYQHEFAFSRQLIRAPQKRENTFAVSYPALVIDLATNHMSGARRLASGV